MDAWLTEKLNEMTPGGYGIWAIVVWYIGQNIFKMLASWQAERKLSFEDRQANREGFTKQVVALQEEVEGLRTENRGLRGEYDSHRRQCVIETDQLREDLVLVNKRLSGVFRKVADIAIRVARGDVDQNVVQAILDLAKEAEDMSHTSVKPHR